MINTTKILNYAVIQSVHCVFGTGSTAGEAFEDAAGWLEPRKSDGEAYTAEMVSSECEDFSFDGDLRLICRNDDEERFDSYLKNQGGFTLTDSGWVAA